MSKSLYELFPPRTMDADYDRESNAYAPDGSTWDEYDERHENDHYAEAEAQWADIEAGERSQRELAAEQREYDERNNEEEW